MTFSDLQTLVLSWLDDPNAGYFTLPQVNVWLNNAQREVQKQLIQSGETWYVKSATTNTVQNQDTYILPSDFLKVNRLDIVTSGTGVTATTTLIYPVNMIEAQGYPQGPARPDCYYLLKDCFALRPVPDNTYQLKLIYSYRVADMVYDNQEPDVPPQYQEYVAVLATLDGFLKDQRDPSPMLEKKKQYMELMKQDSEDRTVDLPRMVNAFDNWDYGDLWV